MPKYRKFFCGLLFLSALFAILPTSSSQSLATLTTMTTQTITSSSLSYSTSYSNSTTTLSTQSTGITLVRTMNATSAQFIIPTMPPCYAAMIGFIPTSSPIYISYSGANQVFDLYVLSYDQNYVYTRYYYSSGPCVPSDATWHRSITRPSGTFQVPLTVYNRSDWNTYLLLVTTRAKPNAQIVVTMWPFGKYYETEIMTTVAVPFTTSAYVQLTMTQTITSFETLEQTSSPFTISPQWAAIAILAALTVGYLAYKSNRKRGQRGKHSD